MAFFEAYLDACGEASKLLDAGQQPETLGPLFPHDWALHCERSSLLSLKGPEEAGNGPGIGKVLG